MTANTESAAVSPKTIALMLYPGLTALDLIGPLQVLSMVDTSSPDFRTVVVSESIDAMPSDTPLWMTASHTFEEIPDPYVVVVPGGVEGTYRTMANPVVLDYLRNAAASARYLTSVCTGSLILGAAGLLDGREATTHWAALDLLGKLGAKPVRKRWVEDGPIITAAGVSAGIDMALYLSSALLGEQAARNLQLFIEYDPQPPFGPIDWDAFDIPALSPLVTSSLRPALAEHPELLARLTN